MTFEDLFITPNLNTHVYTERHALTHSVTWTRKCPTHSDALVQPKFKDLGEWAGSISVFKLYLLITVYIQYYAAFISKYRFRISDSECHSSLRLPHGKTDSLAAPDSKPEDLLVVISVGIVLNDKIGPLYFDLTIELDSFDIMRCVCFIISTWYIASS